MFKCSIWFTQIWLALPGALNLLTPGNPPFQIYPVLVWFQITQPCTNYLLDRISLREASSFASVAMFCLIDPLWAQILLRAHPPQAWISISISPLSHTKHTHLLVLPKPWIRLQRAILVWLVSALQWGGYFHTEGLCFITCLKQQDKGPFYSTVQAISEPLPNFHSYSCNIWILVKNSDFLFLI